MPGRGERGFTLIELSIVLVVIGLIVGGVLVGQDLIRAAGERAQITQLEKFQTAVNAFYGKYGYLPGDIKDPDASSFGFVARGANPGQGDGNGVLTGWNNTVSSPHVQCQGETSMVWVDLSAAHLIEGNFTTATPGAGPGTAVTGTAISNWFPDAKIGGGNSIVATSGDSNSDFLLGVNYFSLEVPVTINSIGNGCAISAATPGLSVKQAYDIDKKIDDGLPQLGRVVAGAVGFSAGFWSAGQGNSGAYPGTATPASSTTCYDNGNNTSNPMTYSVTQSNGANINCALSFRFQ